MDPPEWDNHGRVRGGGGGGGEVEGSSIVTTPRLGISALVLSVIRPDGQFTSTFWNVPRVENSMSGSAIWHVVGTG